VTLAKVCTVKPSADLVLAAIEATSLLRHQPRGVSPTIWCDCVVRCSAASEVHREQAISNEYVEIGFRYPLFTGLQTFVEQIRTFARDAKYERPALCSWDRLVRPNHDQQQLLLLGLDHQVGELDVHVDST
jgi:hypothetical protein